MLGSHRILPLGRNQFERVLIALASSAGALIVWLFSGFRRTTNLSPEDRARSYWYFRFRLREKIYHRHYCKFAIRNGFAIGWHQSQRELFDRGYRPCMTCMPDRYPCVETEWIPTKRDWLKSTRTGRIPPGSVHVPERLMTIARK